MDDDTPVGAWLVMAVGLLNLVFQVTMLAYNIVGIPLGILH